MKSEKNIIQVVLGFVREAKFLSLFLLRPLQSDSTFSPAPQRIHLLLLI